MAALAVSVCVFAGSLVSPSPAQAASVAASFNSVTVTANPQPWTISGIANTTNGSVAGGDYARIYTGQQPATGVVVDYGFTVPKYQVTGVELFNNGGGVLTDFDGIGGALLEVSQRPGSTTSGSPFRPRCCCSAVVL